MKVTGPEHKNVRRTAEFMDSRLQNPAVEALKVVGSSPLNLPFIITFKPYKPTIDKTETRMG